jgi:regulator of nucleoside diphosphate kinase
MGLKQVPPTPPLKKSASLQLIFAKAKRASALPFSLRALAAPLPVEPQVERPNLIVTTHDARRLEALLLTPVGQSSPMASLLEQELLRAQLVGPENLPVGTVTMNARVICKDESSGELHEIELVYPHEADSDKGKISVLAPIGAALLGMSVGSAIEWPVPGGRVTRVRVIDVPLQSAHKTGN